MSSILSFYTKYNCWRRNPLSRQRDCGWVRLQFCIVLLKLGVVGLEADGNPALPIDAYGVWDRTASIVDDARNPDYDQVRGIRMDSKWADIQPAPGVFDWAFYQHILDTAVETGRYVACSVRVGPECPSWLYENGVPLVEINTPKFDGRFPYSLDSDYKRYYFEMIDAFGTFLRSQPKNKLDKIVFIQVMTGATGDETPYKGKPFDSQYDISKEEWLQFRLEAFGKFRQVFLEGDEESRISLLFNNIDPELGEEVEWQWVQDNIGSGFGIKGSAYVRGHHLTNERTFKETWIPYMVDPEDLALFSRAEMDRTWLKPYYTLNRPLGFYWGALSGLNTGLSLWDMNDKSLHESVVDPKVNYAVKFFNKYAPLIYPEKATAAYSIFHLGLNSANVEKYPESDYGAASKTNEDRYLAICRAHADQGARMDDVSAATKGQVYQRDQQTGYNDAGWEIEEGNYERWINQIDPDGTSVGLFRLNDEPTDKWDIYDRFGRTFDHASGKDTMYFRFHEKVFSDSAPSTLTFNVIWLDKRVGSTWEFRYDDGNGSVRTAAIVTGLGDGEWKTETIVVEDGVMLGKGPRGADFMLVNTDAIDDIFHGIEVDIVRVGASGNGFEKFAQKVGLVGGAFDDDDADGVSNLLEFGFAGNPLDRFELARFPSIMTDDVGGLCLRTFEVSDEEYPEVRYRIEMRESLREGSWGPISLEERSRVMVKGKPDYDEVVYGISENPKFSGSAFFRIKLDEI